MRRKTLFTKEQEAFIRENVKGKPRKEMLSLLNETFSLDIKMNQYTAWTKNHRVSSGLDGRFRPGQAPPNKGKKGVGGWEPTQFKSGRLPHNYRPVGSERVNGEGYIDVKVSDPRTWRSKHILVWEEANGPVPKGHVVIFGDGDKLNVSLDNLILVSRGQLAVMNKNGLIQKNADLTRTGVILADIHQKVGQRKRGRKK